MSKPRHKQEYLSHVTLMILGNNLDPQSVSRSLRLRPTQAWRQGEPKTRDLHSTYEWGGWKKALPNAQLTEQFARQLAFWVKALAGRAKAISKLSRAGNLCALNCYIGSSGTASIVIPPELQRAIAALGLELQLSFFAYDDGG
ncbi:DUF4279 domain-containing protein [Betaproteobacteria bacterium SCN2]|jgi:hypothetical protein|nr:DUF4279 domain-containing protein [Betaproteobacteria bacterium SCN2]